MSFVRFTPGDDSIRPGYLFGENILDLSSEVGSARCPLSDCFDATTALLTSAEIPLFERATVNLELPVEPSKIVRLDGCYEHDTTDEGFNPYVESAGLNDMEEPSLWVAPNSTLTAHRNSVSVPAQMTDVRPGVELGIVVDSPASALEPADASEVIGGFTVCMDLAAHDDIPGLEGYRMFDTSLPCGPSVIERDSVEPMRRALGIRHNGELVDVQSTASLRFSIGKIVSYVSSVMTLSPGDLITTGTPIRGVPALSDGDTVEAWIESIGTLETTIEWESDNE